MESNLMLIDFFNHNMLTLLECGYKSYLSNHYRPVSGIAFYNVQNNTFKYIPVYCFTRFDFLQNSFLWSTFVFMHVNHSRNYIVMILILIISSYIKEKISI